MKNVNKDVLALMVMGILGFGSLLSLFVLSLFSIL